MPKALKRFNEAIYEIETEIVCGQQFFTPTK
jgi:hypothetical protein